ncbi:hypothetical protein CHS0354_027690 [Potamilus streckersoni]|uniref:TIR domain-containing protein n=1 Tax=Potamilus streckersoni TaxID=2493646 RepID=A0AAE0T0H3_9BIVA|nr:hypothetical protein CHS0354_027690 [Potamilus streckersoni]
MNTMIWIPCVTIIMTICIVHVRSITCTVTLCSIPNFCGNGRECHTNPDTCKSECVCTDNVTHELCRTDEVKLSTNSPVTSSQTGTLVHHSDTTVYDVRNTEAPLTQSTDCLNNYSTNTMPCPSGIPCLYGDCIVDNLTGVANCECYPGATGVLCNEPCCLDCGPYGVCRVNNADNTQYCNCHPDYKGERCTMLIASDVSKTKVPLMQKTDCLSKYTRNTRFCLGMIPCFYGDCVTDNETSITGCKCYPGAVGDLCTDPCCLDCGLHGECRVNMADGSQFCSCYINYTGEGCTTLKTIDNTGTPRVEVEKDTWYLWVVGVCVVVLFMLLILLIVLPYLMWKHRVILIMKLVHYFQPYEDQDYWIWDALVLYHSDPRDEEFVLRKLYPMLEKMGFKVNIHFKDVTVGETVTNSNSIIQAVQNSRRTILVLSKNYVKSELTKLEYQCAQKVMLQKKHRIIPILLEDITEIKDTIDPTVKVILNSVTCIMWSGENNTKKLQKFWKRLELSMPKRQMMKDEGTVQPEYITIHVIDANK